MVYVNRIAPQHKTIHQKTSIPHKQRTGVGYTCNLHNNNLWYSFPAIKNMQYERSKQRFKKIEIENYKNGCQNS